MESRAQIVQSVERLRVVVADHKSEIRRRRHALRHAKAALVALEEQCRELGIALVKPGEGGRIHGRQEKEESKGADEAGVEVKSEVVAR